MPVPVPSFGGLIGVIERINIYAWHRSTAEIKYLADQHLFFFNTKAAWPESDYVSSTIVNEYLSSPAYATLHRGFP